MSVQEENFKSKPKNFRLEKCLLFGVTLIQAVVFKKLRLFYKMFLCLPPPGPFVCQKARVLED